MPQFMLPLPCSFSAEALGVRREDLGSANPCVESDWMADSAGWADTEGSG